jgi:hypothetical protein
VLAKRPLDSRLTLVTQAPLTRYAYVHRVGLADIHNALLWQTVAITVLLVFAVQLADMILLFVDQAVQHTIQVADLTRTIMFQNQLTSVVDYVFHKTIVVTHVEHL